MEREREKIEEREKNRDENEETRNKKARSSPPHRAKDKPKAGAKKVGHLHKRVCVCVCLSPRWKNKCRQLLLLPRLLLPCSRTESYLFSPILLFHLCCCCCWSSLFDLMLRRWLCRASTSPEPHTTFGKNRFHFPLRYFTYSKCVIPMPVGMTTGLIVDSRATWSFVIDTLHRATTVVEIKRQTKGIFQRNKEKIDI